MNTVPRIDNLPVGAAVLLQFGTDRFHYQAAALFLGVTGKGDDRLARFAQVNVSDEPARVYEWEAYRYLGGWVYGSSADRLRLVAVLGNAAQ
jgi:hypothetical protein